MRVPMTLKSPEISSKISSTVAPRSAHARITPQCIDFSGLGEELRLDHGPGSPRSSGRWPPTFYTHFQSMDELLSLGTQELRVTLHSALEQQRKSAKPHENVIAFSRAMFDHAHGYRNVYFALLNTGAWPIVRQQLQAVLEDLIRRECKAEIAKLKTANSDVPVDLFVHYLTAAFFSVLIWWLNRRSRLTPSQIDD